MMVLAKGFIIFGLFTLISGKEEGDYTWEILGNSSTIPKNAVLAGAEDFDGEFYLIFVARVKIGDEIIPSKLLSKAKAGDLTNSMLYTSKNDTIFSTADCEILVGADKFDWIRFNSKAKEIPDNAVVGGMQKDKNPYYIGRAKFDCRYYIAGKVDKATKHFTAIKGADTVNTYTEYELLVWDQKCSTFSNTSNTVGISQAQQTTPTVRGRRRRSSGQSVIPNLHLLILIKFAILLIY